MKQELIVKGATVDEALQKGADVLGVPVDKLEYQVLVEPKKGILGIGKVAAELKVSYSYTPDASEVALEFVKKLLSDMEADATAEMEEGEENEMIIRISGKDAGLLIGYHGETMDALQYLTNLAANKKEEDGEKKDYKRIVIDVENYRARRVETLKALARRMAGKVLKYKKSISLEPMSAYERRIIHYEIQNIEGVATYSVGADNNRKVVICLKGMEK